MLLLPSLAHGQLGFGRKIQVLDKAWNESGILKFYSLRLQKTSKVTITESLLKSLEFERRSGGARNNMSGACQRASQSGLQSSSKAGGLRVQ